MILGELKKTEKISVLILVACFLLVLVAGCAENDPQPKQKSETRRHLIEMIEIQ